MHRLMPQLISDYRATQVDDRAGQAYDLYLPLSHLELRRHGRLEARSCTCQARFD